MRMSSKLIAALVLIAMPVVEASAATCPGLLVTVESDGRVSQGSKDGLKAAVSAGDPIRIGLGLDLDIDGGVDLTHWADALFVTLWENDVFAQLPPIHRQSPRRGASDVELSDEHAVWWSSIGTNGLWRGRFDNAAPRAIKVKSWWCRGARTVVEGGVR